MFGVGADCDPLALVARGLPGSRIRRLDSDRLREGIPIGTLAAQVDAWLVDFAAAVAYDIEPRPRADVLVDAGRLHDCADGAVVSARPRGGVVWVGGFGAADYLGTEDLDSAGSGLAPLTSDTWLTLRDAAELSGVSSESLSADRLMRGLGEFHRLALGAERVNRALQMVDIANQQVARVTHHRSEREAARESLFGVLGSPGSAPAEGGSDLALALDMVGRHEKIEFRLPRSLRTRSAGPQAADRVRGSPPLQDVLQESGVRYRRVRLRSGDRWWRGDSGAMLAFRSEDRSPVALLPSVFGRYREVAPASGRLRRVGARRARIFDAKAWGFYSSCREDRGFGMGSLIRFGFRGMRLIAVISAILGLLAGLQAVAPAFMSGLLSDRLIPPVADGTPVFFAVSLASLAVLSTTLLILQGMLMTRVEGRAAARVAVGTVDRLLDLPLSFFRRFQAGDLMIRILGLWTMRDQLSGVVTHVVLVVVCLLPALGLLFLYDTALALTSVVVGLLALGATAAVALMHIAPQRDRLACVRDMIGRLHQHIGAMSKLRSTGAEDSAFASLARGYRDQLSATRRCSVFNQHLVALSAAAPALGSAALFAIAHDRGAGSVESGRLLGGVRSVGRLPHSSRQLRAVVLSDLASAADLRADPADPADAARRKARSRILENRAGAAARAHALRGCELPLQRGRPADPRRCLPGSAPRGIRGDRGELGRGQEHPAPLGPGTRRTDQRDRLLRPQRPGGPASALGAPPDRRGVPRRDHATG